MNSTKYEAIRFCLVSIISLAFSVFIVLLDKERGLYYSILIVITLVMLAVSIYRIVWCIKLEHSGKRATGQIIGFEGSFGIRFRQRTVFLKIQIEIDGQTIYLKTPQWHDVRNVSGVSFEDKIYVAYNEDYLCVIL